MLVSLYDSPAPQRPKVLSEADGMRAIDRAITQTQNQQVHRDLRYGYFLRQLPEWVLLAVLHAGEGDVPAQRVLVYLTVRSGAVVHGNKNPVISAGKRSEDEQNDLIDRVAKEIFRDVCREIFRRKNYLDFAPCKDPFGSDLKPRRMEMTREGKALKGEEREYLEQAMSGEKNQEA